MHLKSLMDGWIDIYMEHNVLLSALLLCGVQAMAMFCYAYLTFRRQRCIRISHTRAVSSIEVEHTV